MDFLKWYKYKIETNDQEPPEAIWENIQDNLDIEQSWSHINKHLSKKSASQRIRYIVTAASFLLLLSLGYFTISSKFNQNIFILPTNESINNNQTLSYKQTETESNINSDDKIARKELIINNNNTQNSKFVVISSTKKDTKTKNADVNIANSEILFNNQLIALTNREIHLNDTIIKDLRIATNYTSYELESDATSERNSFKKLYIGTTGQLANTWLLNEKTYNGLESTSLTTSNASFGSNFGIYIGTNIYKFIDLQLDINVLAKNNQVYHEYFNGNYIENKFTFNYSQLVFSTRFHFISKKFIQGEHGVNLGGYVGYLHSAYQILDDETINLTSNYTNFDYGLFFGYEFVIPLSKKLGFGTGVKAYYGLQNIYSGNELIPSYLNKTNNASINISFSLKYNLK